MIVYGIAAGPGGDGRGADLACSRAVPALACASRHRGMPAILPSSPGGVVTAIAARSCSPSLRENVTEKGLYAPAAGERCPR